jgi:hypothetical protein
MRKTHKSHFPALNVHRRNEPVATDTIYATHPALDSGGMTQAQIFVGRKSLVVDVYGMKRDGDFVKTLQDQIRKRGAMSQLISDQGRNQISNLVKDVLRAYCIDDWQSEAYFQHQNFAEHRWNHIKRLTHWLMKCKGAPPEAWLECLKYVCDVMNHTAVKSLDDQVPLTVLTG